MWNAVGEQIMTKKSCISSTSFLRAGKELKTKQAVGDHQAKDLDITKGVGLDEVHNKLNLNAVHTPIIPYF